MATRKKNRKTGKRESAVDASYNIHETSDKVSKIVDDALIRMADSISKQIWFEAPNAPGLHVLRHRRGTEYIYHAVRVVFVDDGTGTKWHANYIPGSAEVKLSDFNEVAFQQVKE